MRRFGAIGRKSRVRFVGPDSGLVSDVLYVEMLSGANKALDQQELTNRNEQLEGCSQPAEMTDEEKFERDSLDRFGAESSHHGYERHMLERD